MNTKVIPIGELGQIARYSENRESGYKPKEVKDWYKYICIGVYDGDKCVGGAIVLHNPAEIVDHIPCDHPWCIYNIYPRKGYTSAEVIKAASSTILNETGGAVCIILNLYDTEELMAAFQCGFTRFVGVDIADNAVYYHNGTQ